MTVILLVGGVLGLGWNAWSRHGFPLRSNALLKPGDEEVSIAEAKKRFDKGHLFLDARPAAFYPLGHIAGALSLPEDDFDHAFARLDPRLRSALALVVHWRG